MSTRPNNDNLPLDPPDMPEWAWDIIERHDLAFRADTALAAANALLEDVSFDLRRLSRTVFSQQAFTPEAQRQAADCEAQIADALRLAALCPSTPKSGKVRDNEDGTLTWAPLEPTDAH